MAENRSANRDHKVILVNQEQMEVSGINRIESFNPEEILLETELGLVAVRGEELDIRNLNLEQGIVEIEGAVYEIIYTGEKGSGGTKKGIFERLFK